MATLTVSATASLTGAKRIVIKIGSALLVSHGELRARWLDGLAEDVAMLKERGAQVILVSSGSIALGRGILGLPSGELPLEQSQACASVGQIRLARAYQEALEPHGIVTSQVLLTLEDSADRRRYLNSRATLDALLGLGVVPIVNENDTVATDEIRYGDNDRLAANIAVTVGADRLVLLSDVDGLYTANPSVDPNAKHIALVEEITHEIEDMAGEPVSGLSKGGMKTKVMAAKTAISGGCTMAITEGAKDRPLSALEAGARATWFLAAEDPAHARKRWIGAMKPKGEVQIDAGAVSALAKGKSLLPVGVEEVVGHFGRGEPVVVLGPDGARIGLGLSRYTSEEAEAIKGAHSEDIQAILGYSGRAALIHRDDLVT
ncbi:glutamate 5-kinase [Celeribacter halophilus]|uniref:Glutamate 5-kinase n=1 Tax=Celeribacter halophilus TaxID=576117 RepID=A0AAW7XQY1_9RHOB|nr:glutamate 5-kinase [Celeribacter halophilus]MDO6455482.1 glutamate 5-kinase [Celeribacter halophilus]MDO6721686.1 glutamate 5-kinase [Celeribacter halophilus]